MKWLIVIFIILTVSSLSFAANTKKTKVVSLENKWAKDVSLMRITSTDSFILYGVKGTATPSYDNNSVINAWTSTLYTKKGRAEFKRELKGTYSAKSKWGLDCNNKKYAIISGYYYNANGRMLSSFSDESNWNEVIPGTVAESVFDIVCSIKFNNQNTQSVQDVEVNVYRKGFVLETIDNDGYTYLLVLSENSQREWIALPETPTAVGDKIEYPEGKPLTNFNSKTLHKTFDKIMFVPSIKIIK